jgi:hypothetical protein
MGHGTPIETLGEDSVGVSGIYMLDMHISSTRHIARFWGLVPLAPAPVAAATPQQDDAVAVGKASDLAAGATDPPSEAAKPPIRVPEKVAAQAGGLGSGFEETLRFQMGLTFQLLDAWARWWSLSMKPHARITELPE